MKKVAALLTASTTYLTLVSKAFAQRVTEGPVAAPTGFGVPTDTRLGTIVGNLIAIVLVLAALLVFVFLVIGAFNWITSGGDKEKISTARETILHALIGLVILAVAFVIARVAGSITGIDILKLEFPTLSATPTPPVPVQQR